MEAAGKYGDRVKLVLAILAFLPPQVIILEPIIVDTFIDQTADVWVHTILDQKLCRRKFVEEESVVQTMKRLQGEFVDLGPFANL